jgi:hypothetical protein
VIGNGALPYVPAVFLSPNQDSELQFEKVVHTLDRNRTAHYRSVTAGPILNHVSLEVSICSFVNPSPFTITGWGICANILFL